MRHIHIIKRFAALLLAVVLLGAAAGCASQQEKNEKTILGRWRDERYSSGYSYEFLSDGKFRANDGEISGRYELGEEYLTLRTSFSEYRYEYELNGDSLTLSRNGYTETMKRVS